VIISLVNRFSDKEPKNTQVVFFATLNKLSVNLERRGAQQQALSKSPGNLNDPQGLFFLSRRHVAKSHEVDP
jgi:hypothetical protein